VVSPAEEGIVGEEVRKIEDTYKLKLDVLNRISFLLHVEF
jgi:hypothetical protein